MKIHPRGCQILIRQKEAETKVGTLFLPTLAQEAPSQGTVLAKGPLVDDLEQGDEVIWTDFAGVQLPGSGLLLMDEKDVLARVEE